MEHLLCEAGLVAASLGALVASSSPPSLEQCHPQPPAAPPPAQQPLRPSTHLCPQLATQVRRAALVHHACKLQVRVYEQGSMPAAGCGADPVFTHIASHVRGPGLPKRHPLYPQARRFCEYAVAWLNVSQTLERIHRLPSVPVVCQGKCLGVVLLILHGDVPASP